MAPIIDNRPGPAIPQPFNMADHVLSRSVQQHPDKIALQILRPSGAERWSYSRLMAAVQGCAAGLLARGLVPGDRILMRLGNQVEFPVLFLGALAAGLVPVVTAAQLTKAEITPITAQIKPRLIVAADGVALPAQEQLATPIPEISASDIRAMEKLPPAPFHSGDPERPGYVVFTSGTSGKAMAVLHAHRSILARQMMHADWEGLTAQDRLLHAGAFNWTFTLGTGLLDPWTVGATALIPADGITPAQLPLFLKRFDATIFAAAPGVYRQMLRAPFPQLPRLRHGLSAGEKLAPETRDRWCEATGTPICEALGLSELSTFISESPSRPARAGATGFAQTGRRIAALTETLQPAGFDQPGQLAVDRHDPGLMLGYLDAPAASAARFHGDWFLTGDQVSIAADGMVSYIGRIDDQMNAGGFRVSPLEVEAVMARFPGLTDCAVTEIELRSGTRIIACFYTAPSHLPEADLLAHAQMHLARYKQPRLFRKLDLLPRGANSKLNRRALRQMDQI